MTKLAECSGSILEVGFKTAYRTRYDNDKPVTLIDASGLTVSKKGDYIE